MTTIPASRVAAQDQGAALAHPPHSTQAPAAQKRGGGLAHRIQLIAITQGRQPMSEGGAIESQCCAAAGIFQPNPQHTPKVRIPHERLRRGAKHIATLRLMTRSPAQLVEGGKRPPKPTDNALIRTLCAQIREQSQEIAALRIANTDLLQRLEKAEGGRV
ncbi:glycoside hydrolase [Pseudomonas aeruginosa]|nr:glycoside hydrolase [Pseudomonas aeruginosa]